MIRLKKIVSSSIFLILFLLTFLLIFEGYAEIPTWLQPIGRMHPLILHFPIALIILLLLLDVFQSHIEENSYIKIRIFLLYFTGLTTALSALMGFFLSLEDGYSSELMEQHKWLGVALCYVIYALILSYKYGNKIYRTFLYSSMVLVVLSGHMGAGLTHGTDFLVEPIASAEKVIPTKDTPIYEGFIDPVFSSKCKSCHNPEKRKGELDMTSWTALMKGGENGPAIIPFAIDSSLVLQKVFLPIDHEEHMPPEGKPQLSNEELELILAWIKQGADAQMAMAHLSPNDTLYLVTNKILSTLKEEQEKPAYEFDFADSELIASLNNSYRSVVQVAQNIPALDVNIYISQAFKIEYLNELKKVKNQIVSLNLAYMPITNQDLAVIGTFTNLEKLNLNYTNISGEGLEVLKQCEKLTSLSLSGTSVNTGLLELFENLPRMEEVYLWRTSLESADFDQLKSQRPDILFNEGFIPNPKDTTALPPPLLGNKTRIVDLDEKVVLKHKLQGVTIKYTTNGMDPDSTASEMYSKPFKLPDSTLVMVRAYKDGWLPSEAVSFPFFKKGFEPEKLVLLTQPNEKYPGKGAASLIDRETGSAEDYKGRAWLGFDNEPFSVQIDFGEKAPTIQQVVLSYGQNMRQNIMPPVALEVWGGNDTSELKLIKKVSPKVPSKNQGNREEMIPVSFAPSKFRYYKVVAFPIAKLPKWHRQKGKKGLLFVDQLFFY